MSKVIKISEGRVYISHQGRIINIDLSSLDFVPYVDQLVEVYEDGDILIIKPYANTSNQYFSQYFSQTYPARKVNKFLYIALCILLGGLGIHRMYAGKVGSGVMMAVASLLFFWLIIPVFIVYIVVIYDLIRGCLLPADAQGNYITI